MKKIILTLIWIISLIIVSIYTYENPEKYEKIKNYFKKNKTTTDLKHKEGKIFRSPGNSFVIEFEQEISFDEKTAFAIYDEKLQKFDPKLLKIYYQSGNLYYNGKIEKINLSKTFTTAKNGGVKTVITHKNGVFLFISSLKDNCFYASILSLKTNAEIFKTKCLPDKLVDYNGLGSSHIHYNDKIFLSIGVPEQASSKIRELAQDKNSYFGKIIEIDKNELGKIINNEKKELNVDIFTSGHRNPQGLTRINNSFFSVEHGPKGGDELNKIIEGKNYGWPKVSYGSKYLYDDNGAYYEISHENKEFEEPLFALVPSVGISALNTCPQKIQKFYKKPCLLALSLYGNSLRPGRSIIIYLLNKEMNKVHSIEKILLRDDLKLRHFVTNSKNELYEDEKGNIYISADKKGIYRLGFVGFRN